MRFGTPLAAGLGSPEHFVQGVELASGSHGDVLATLHPRKTTGPATWHLYSNCRRVDIQTIAEGAAGIFRIPRTYGQNNPSLFFLRVGHSADPSMDFSAIARQYEEAAAESRRVTLTWTWEPEIIGWTGDGGYTLSWGLNGLSLLNTLPYSGATNWRTLSFDLVVNAGIATVTLYAGNNVLATGTRAVGNILTMNPQNSSGVWGTVTVPGGATTQLGCSLFIRWPAAMKLLRGTTNPPAAVIATIPFDGTEDEATWTEPADLAAGTYYYGRKAVSDSGVDGTLEAFTPAAVIHAPPGPVSNMHRVSGNAQGTPYVYSDNAFTAWGLVGVTTTTGQPDPTGGSHATLITPSGTDGYLQQQTFGTYPAHSSTLQLFVKYAGAQNPRTITVSRDAASADFDIANGAVVSQTGCTATITAAANGYWKLTITSTDAGGSSILYGIFLHSNPGGGSDYACCLYQLTDTTNISAGGTIIGWTAPVGGADSYNVYLGMILGYLDTQYPVASGAGTTANLPAITDYPGTVYVLVRAVKDGVEEKNLDCLPLNYDVSGNYFEPPPNAAAIDGNQTKVTSGLTLQLTGVYATAMQASAATTMLLYARSTTGGYGGYVASAPLTNARAGILQAALIYAFPTPGLYYVKTVAATVNGTQGQASPEMLIYVDASAMPDSTAGQSIQVTRG
jgi:hypothetical protein